MHLICFIRGHKLEPTFNRFMCLRCDYEQETFYTWGLGKVARPVGSGILRMPPEYWSYLAAKAQAKHKNTEKTEDNNEGTD